MKTKILLHEFCTLIAGWCRQIALAVVLCRTQMRGELLCQSEHTKSSITAGRQVRKDWLARRGCLVGFYLMLLALLIPLQGLYAETLPEPRIYDTLGPRIKPNPGTVEDFMAGCPVILRGRVLKIGQYTYNARTDDPAFRQYGVWFATVEVTQVYYPLRSENIGKFIVNFNKFDTRYDNYGAMIERNMFIRDLALNQEYVFFFDGGLKFYDLSDIPPTFNIKKGDLYEKYHSTNQVELCRLGFTNSIAIMADDAQYLKSRLSDLVKQRKITESQSK